MYCVTNKISGATHSQHNCAVCNKVIILKDYFCKKHFDLLPKELKGKLRRIYRLFWASRYSSKFTDAEAQRVVKQLDAVKLECKQYLLNLQ
jgi:hypothetical protein